MSIQLYNTLTKKKEPFETVEPGKAKIYLCGPTVYDLLHIGNFRGAIFFNLLRNWLEYRGYQTTFVYNYTDVDDKIIKRANQDGVESTEISERYIKEFETDFNRLGLKAHDHNPKVTEYMPQIIKFVEDLIEKEKAYVIDGEVFFEIDKFEGYGKLSGKNLDDLEAGQRVEVDQRKRSPFDFVLWKPSKEGEPSWDSPWGKGRPGWHIECSAMIQSILGDTIDIHGGGIDLIFPHHENEIAQGEGRTGCSYCSHWVHNNFINLKDQKMSKSLGNVITARGFMDKYHPEILKYVMLSSHYRAMLNVSDDKIAQSISALVRVYQALEGAREVLSHHPETGAKARAEFIKISEEHDKKIAAALDDDFNTVEMMASLFEMVRAWNSMNLATKKKTEDSAATAKFFIEWMGKYGGMLALFVGEPKVILSELNEILVREKNIDVQKVEHLIAERARARDEKDWGRADEMRDQLHGMGIEFKDGAEGTTWSVKID